MKMRWLLGGGITATAVVLAWLGRKSSRLMYRRRDFDPGIKTPAEEFRRQQEDE